MQRHLAFAEPGPYFAAALVVLLDRQRFFQELDMRLLQSLSVRVDRDRSRLQLRPDPFAQVAQEFAEGVAALIRVDVVRTAGFGGRQPAQASLGRIAMTAADHLVQYQPLRRQYRLQIIFAAPAPRFRQEAGQCRVAPPSRWDAGILQPEANRSPLGRGAWREEGGTSVLIVVVGELLTKT